MDRRHFLSMTAIFGGSLLFGIEDEGIGSVADSVSKTIVERIAYKFSLVENEVGYTAFNIVSFDEALKTARNIGCPFTKKEIDFIESLFYASPSEYGFLGENTVDSLTKSVKKDEIIYMKRTMHYLYKGDALDKYNEIRNIIGKTAILTSGVRMPVKQMTLFLRKMSKEKYNLRNTSMVIAPPAYSYHSIGDFDIGKVGMGRKNFTQDFAKTDMFKRLQDGGYISLRYTDNNLFGVQYEPWHVKVVGRKRWWLG